MIHRYKRELLFLSTRADFAVEPGGPGVEIVIEIPVPADPGIEIGHVEELVELLPLIHEISAHLLWIRLHRPVIILGHRRWLGGGLVFKKHYESLP